MNYSSFLSWFKSKKFLNRVFILILIIKPLLDTFYDLTLFGNITFLKVIGILIFLICFYTILARKKVVYHSSLGLIFTWAALYTINLILVLLFNLNMNVLSEVFKMGMTVYILYYFFREVRSEQDVLGYLFAYLLSLIFLIGGFAYSDIFIQEVEITRGAERIITVYGDIGSIGIQYNLGFIVLIFLASANSLLKVNSILPRIIPVYIIVGFYILLKIHHSASYIIFFILLGYYAFVSARQNALRTLLFGFLISIPVSIYYYDQIFENVNNLINNDIQVVQGEKDAEAAFHGRGGRWVKHWGYFTSGSFLNYFIGLVGIEHPELVGHGPHNDYLRMTFSSGLIGSLSFIFFNLGIALRVTFSKMALGVKFGILAIIGFWFLQSVSLTPSSYHAFNFVYGPLIILSLKWKTIQK